MVRPIVTGLGNRFLRKPGCVRVAVMVGGGSGREIAIAGQYRVSLAKDERAIQKAQALRFQVFNLELREGLKQAFETGLDCDEFDAVCDHLLVEAENGEVVGTYRLQTGPTAQRQRGYYSEQEFDFGPYETIRDEVVELGRACIHQHHRSFAVLNLLWRGVARYALGHSARYLMGCSSLNSQDPAVGAGAYALLKRHLVTESLRTRPQPGWECPVDVVPEAAPQLPKLLSAYLMLGSRICGPPAIDREFGTIDFLTLLDLATLSPKIINRYLG